MGQYDVPILVGAGLLVGYFVLTNPQVISGLFPHNTSSPVDSSGEFVDTSGESNPNDSNNCSSLCKAGDCDGYDDEGCTKGCSKCGGGGGSFSSGDVNCNDGQSCSDRCSKGWCNSYRKCCSQTGCSKCNNKSGSGSSSGPSGCNLNCKSGERAVKSNGQCQCEKVPSSSGGGGGGCKSCCSCRGGACKGLTGNTCSTCCNPPKSSSPKPSTSTSKPTPAKTSQCAGFTGATKTACLNAHAAWIEETKVRVSIS